MSSERIVRLAALIALSLAPAAAGTADAETYDVPGDFDTIALALAGTGGGDEIVVGAGIHYEHGLLMRSGVTLRGATGDPADVIISAQGLGRVMDCSGVTGLTRIADLTIAGGIVATGNGGGVTMVGGQAVFENCIFRGNTAALGGALYLSGSAATVVDCVFSRNVCNQFGGAIYITSNTPQFTNCTITGSTAPSFNGSAVSVLDGTALFDGCIIAFGAAGFGVDAAGSSTFSDCCVFGNPAGDWIGAPLPGNFSADPQFCAVDPDGDRFWGLQSDSPCAPANSPSGGLIGARGVDCAGVGADEGSWGAMKNRFR